MATNTTTTTTTTPAGETTVQKVVNEGEAWFDNADSKFHTTITNWLTHIKTLSSVGVYASAAYTIYQFGKHFI